MYANDSSYDTPQLLHDEWRRKAASRLQTHDLREAQYEAAIEAGLLTALAMELVGAIGRLDPPVARSISADIQRRFRRLDRSRVPPNVSDVLQALGRLGGQP
jgi:hypothetical protein